MGAPASSIAVGPALPNITLIASMPNIAVTVGPNIFRPLTVRPADLFNAGTYYDVVIRMMENYEILFEGAPMPNPDDFDLIAQADAMSKQGVGTVMGNLPQTITSLSGRDNR